MLAAAPALMFLAVITGGQGTQGEATGAAFLSAAFVIAYEVPSIVAYLREKDNRVQIYLINVLTGWTVVGWFVALVLSAGPKKD